MEDETVADFEWRFEITITQTYETRKTLPCQNAALFWVDERLILGDATIGTILFR